LYLFLEHLIVFSYLLNFKNSATLPATFRTKNFKKIAEDEKRMQEHELEPVAECADSQIQNADGVDSDVLEKPDSKPKKVYIYRPFI